METDLKTSEPTFKEMYSIYKEWFSIGYIPGMQNRLALINLIGWLVSELKKKKPDITYYQTIYKLATGTGLTDMDIKKLAIISENFSYQCTDFLDFGLELKEVPAKIKEILNKILPF
jgi:hypothetical protein